MPLFFSIHQQHAVAARGETGGEIHGNGGFPNTAFFIQTGNDFTLLDVV